MNDDLASADASGVVSTHTFFVNGRRHTGPHDADSLAAALLGDDPGPHRPEPAAFQDASRRTAVDTLPDISSEEPETPDRDGAFPRLSHAQVAVLERFGTRRNVAPGDVLHRAGDRGYDFDVVLSGAVAIVEYLGRPDQPQVTVHEERRFLGELDLFTRQPVSRTALVIRAGEVLRVPAAGMREVFGADRELFDELLRTLLVRRSMLLELAPDLQIIARSGSPAVRRLREYAEANRLTTAVVGDGDEILTEAGTDAAVVVSRTGRVLHDPTHEELTDALRTPHPPRGGSAPAGT